MADPDVVLAKAATIDRCLQRIGDARARYEAPLLPIDVDDIVVLNLQRAIQAAIDLATHVVASEGYGLPDSVADAFALLESHGLIQLELGGRLRRMVGFRNVAIHEYRRLDPAIVEAIVSRHLEDLRAFAAAMVERFATGQSS